MKILIKFLCLLLTIILILGVSGCMNEKQTKYIDVISYMKNKYDDSFTIKSPFGGGAGADSKQVILKSEKYPAYDIWVEYSYETSEYKDNYVDYKLKNDCEAYLQLRLEKAFACKANVERNIPTSGCYAEYSKDTNLEEYLNTSSQNIGFSAVLIYSEYFNKEIVENILSDIVNEKQANIYGTIYFVESENICKEFFNKTLTEQQKYPNVFVKKTGASVTKFDWR